MYENAKVAWPINFGPEYHGWSTDREGQWRIMWLDGPQTPLSVENEMLTDDEYMTTKPVSSFSDECEDFFMLQ